MFMLRLNKPILNIVQNKRSQMFSMFSTKNSNSNTITKPIVQSMTVETLHGIIKADELYKYQLVDVREEGELQLAQIKTNNNNSNNIHLPLSQSGTWTQQIIRGELLDIDKPVLCLCHHGVRSYQMATFLIQNEFNHVYNIEGGISAYALEMDSTVGIY